MTDWIEDAEGGLAMLWGRQGGERCCELDWNQILIDVV